MSWAFPVTVTDGTTLRDAAETARDEFLAKLSGDVMPEVAEQIEAAITAAEGLLAAVGDPAEARVALSGHANPGHAPRAGWADDHVTVTVARRPVARSEPGAAHPIAEAL